MRRGLPVSLNSNDDGTARSQGLVGEFAHFWHNFVILFVGEVGGEKGWA